MTDTRKGATMKILTARELEGIPKWVTQMEKAGAAWETRQYVVPLLKALERVQKQLANRIRIDDVRASVNAENPPAKCDCETCQSDRQALRDTGWAEGR